MLSATFIAKSFIGSIEFNFGVATADGRFLPSAVTFYRF